MPPRFTMDQINESAHTLTEHISSMITSDANTAITFFNGFMDFCESDEVISTITLSLKDEDVSFNEWWIEGGQTEVENLNSRMIPLKEARFYINYV